MKHQTDNFIYYTFFSFYELSWVKGFSKTFIKKLLFLIHLSSKAKKSKFLIKIFMEKIKKKIYLKYFKKGSSANRRNNF